MNKKNDNSNNNTGKKQKHVCTIHHSDKDESDAITCHVMGDSRLMKGHYGVQCLVRQWIALSLRRRSFQLLSRAGTLAVQCGMSMDDVLCEIADKNREEQNEYHPNHQTMAPQRGMDFLYPFLLTPVKDQKVVGPPLEAHDVPMELWNSVGVTVNELERRNDTPSHNTKLLEEAIGNRWIFIRQTRNGLCRFYTSPGFEKHVVSRELVEETHRANQMDVSELYLVKRDGTMDEKQDFTRGFAHQIALHTRPGIVTKPTLLPNVRIRVKSGDVMVDDTNIQEMDQLWSCVFPDVDNYFGLTEFIPPAQPSPIAKNGDNENELQLQRMTSSNLPTLPKEWTDEGLDENLFVNVGDIDEDDFEWKVLYDILKR